MEDHEYDEYDALEDEALTRLRDADAWSESETDEEDCDMQSHNASRIIQQISVQLFHKRLITPPENEGLCIPTTVFENVADAAAFLNNMTHPQIHELKPPAQDSYACCINPKMCARPSSEKGILNFSGAQVP